MRKIGFIISIFIVSLIIGNSIVFAEDTDSNDVLSYSNSNINIPDDYKRLLPAAGITPDSWLYGLKRFSETIDIFFTFDELKKAEKYIRYAEIRLSEANEMNDLGNDHVISDLLNDYVNDMENSNIIIDQAINDGNDISDLTEFIAVASTIHIDFMQEMLNVVPVKIAPVIRRAINYSYDNSENIIDLLEEIRPIKAAEINAVIAEKYLLKAIEKSEEKNSEEIVKLLLEYDEKINKSQSIIDSFDYIIGENITSVEQLISNVVKNHDEVISDIYETISNSDKSKIVELINSTLNIDMDFIEEVEEIILSENLTLREKISKIYESYIDS